MIILLFLGSNIVLANYTKELSSGNNIKYVDSNNYNNLEKKVNILLENIIEKYKKEYGIIEAYNKINTFYYKLNKMKTSNIKVYYLKNLIWNSLVKYEQQYFINNNIIYVNDLKSPYTYYKGKKLFIYTTWITNWNIYNICDINNKNKCVEYKNTIFQEKIKIKSLKLQNYNSNLLFDNTWIYQLNVKSYIPSSKNYFKNNTELSIYKVNLDYKNKLYDNYNDFFFWSNKLLVWNLCNYKNTDSYIYLAKCEIKKKWDVDLVKYKKNKNINFNSLLDSIKFDLRYIDFISKSDIDWIYEESKKLHSMKEVYNFVKKDLNYNNEVYQYYLQTWKYDLWKDYVFTWTGAYKYKNAVCSWYVNYLKYLFSFKWFTNLQIEEGNYIDIKTWRIIPHSWLKQENYYFDVTFDDWLSQLTSKENLYYKLPKELILLDRVLDKDKEKLNYIKKLSLEDRKIFIFKNYFNIVKLNKYNNKLLEPYILLFNKYNIKNLNEFNLNNLWKNLNEKYFFKLNQNWSLDYFKDKNGKSLSSYNMDLIKVKNINDVIYAINLYNIKNLVLGIEDNKYFYIIIKK